LLFFFFQAEDGIRDGHVTGVQTCALPIFNPPQANAGTASVSIESARAIAKTTGRRIARLLDRSAGRWGLDVREGAVVPAGRQRLAGPVSGLRSWRAGEPGRDRCTARRHSRPA